MGPDTSPYPTHKHTPVHIHLTMICTYMRSTRHTRHGKDTSYVVTHMCMILEASQLLFGCSQMSVH